MDFDTIYTDYVEKCSHETAFNREESEMLYTLACQLPDGSNIVEIGVEFGRSTTTLGFAALLHQHHFTAIDAWVGEYSTIAKYHIENKLIGEWKLPIDLWSMYSSEASTKYHNPINLLHIDGDHSYDSVWTDCQLWLPKVSQGGIACFDDYGHDSLPDVFTAVGDYMQFDGTWEFVGRYGNKLGVFKKQ